MNKYLFIYLFILLLLIVVVVMVIYHKQPMLLLRILMEWPKLIWSNNPNCNQWSSADRSLRAGSMHSSSPHTEQEETAQESTGYSLWILGNQWTTAEQEGAYLKACTLLPQSHWAAMPQASAGYSSELTQMTRNIALTLGLRTSTPYLQVRKKTLSSLSKFQK